MMRTLLNAICVICLGLIYTTSAGTASNPINYALEGTFGEVWLPEDFIGAGPFDDRNFRLTWTVPNPSEPDDPLGTRYFVDATLTIEGIGTYSQVVAWELPTYALVYGLVAFENILEPNDNIAFGICTGGICEDPFRPILWNQDPYKPELFTGTFALGPNLFCSTPPCNSTFANYFFPGDNGGFDAITTLYSGTLRVSLLVSIDVEPQKKRNPINPRFKGQLGVAVLTTDTFDAVTVDPTTVHFGPGAAKPEWYVLDDVDRDDDLDLWMGFGATETNISCGDNDATLIGETYGNAPIIGMDNIKTVGCGNQ